MVSQQPGRNDPCPCGSGRKYKKCCIGAPALLRAGMNTSPWPALNEGDALAGILGSSKEFQGFYEGVRPKLKEFSIVLDPGLAGGKRASTTRTPDGRFIRIRTPVVPASDARYLAHELMHFMLDDEGFPSCGGLNDHNAASALNSAVVDPVVDVRLRQYGFDETDDRVSEIKSNRAQLKNVAHSPQDLPRRAEWIANYLGILLDDAVLGEIPESKSFRQWFSSRYPDIASDAEKLAARILEIGFDKPTTCDAALSCAREHVQAGGGVILPPSPADQWP